VGYHARIEQRRLWHDTLVTLNREAVARLARDWRALPEPDVAPADRDHPYADDLDLLGHASLFQLLWPGGTDLGRDTLRAWLLSPTEAAVVRMRQEAIAELAPMLTLRQELAARSRVGSADPHDVRRFVAWAEDRPWLLHRRVAIWAIRLLTLAILVPLVLQIAGVLDVGFWLLPFVVGIIASFLLGERVHHLFDRAFASHPIYGHYAALFELVSSAAVQSPLLRRLQADLSAEGLAASRQLRRFQRLMELAELRRNALAHFPIHSLTLWDFHVLLLVERWQQTAGRHARGWFQALAEIEALAALAGLAHDNPAWATPSVGEAHALLDAKGLGHPLLAASVRVANDAQVGPPHTFLLVTGSNMSGKSTLLRAVGVNVVLAQTGGPVCAERLSLPPVRLFTSMRVQDSLEEGVSYFMAAVKRLKGIVDAAGHVPPGASPTLLYLLDEVLQGTNTAERQAAVRMVLRHLLAARALGAVTTHDLSLAEADDLKAASRQVHFTEMIDGGAEGTVMSFDYTLRPGLATSRNALKLMRLMGLAPSDQP
jgi:hypothetical protein